MTILEEFMHACAAARATLPALQVFAKKTTIPVAPITRRLRLRTETPIRLHAADVIVHGHVSTQRLPQEDDKLQSAPECFGHARKQGPGHTILIQHRRAVYMPPSYVHIPVQNGRSCRGFEQMCPAAMGARGWGLKR